MRLSSGGNLPSLRRFARGGGALGFRLWPDRDSRHLRESRLSSISRIARHKRCAGARGVEIRFALRVRVNPVWAVPVASRGREGGEPSAQAGAEGGGDQYVDAPEVLGAVAGRWSLVARRQSIVVGARFWGMI